MTEKATRELVKKMLLVKGKGTNVYKWYGGEYVLDNLVDIRDAFSALLEKLGLEAELCDKKCVVKKKDGK